MEVPIASGAEFIGSHTADLLLGAGASLLCFITSTAHCMPRKRSVLAFRGCGIHLLRCPNKGSI